MAEYACDAFGNTIRKSGVKADELKMRFSTKYSDDEVGLLDWHRNHGYRREMGSRFEHGIRTCSVWERGCVIRERIGCCGN